jgi:hypothetical protein
MKNPISKPSIGRLSKNKSTSTKKSSSKTTLRNKADRLFSEHWRKKIGKCERCSKREYLQLCHIHTRGCIKLRYSRLNTLVLCAGCHRWAHDYPIRFSEFVKEKKGKGNYNILIRESNRLETIDIKYYQNIIDNYGCG